MAHLDSKKILIAPLDWGLGHATRSIPVINEFLLQGCEVQIASSGRALILLKQEFPKLKFHDLVSYDVRYPRLIPLPLSLLFQFPKFLKNIHAEHRQVERIVGDEQIGFVISDNRFGCWSSRATSVFITHQVNIHLPWWLRAASPLANYFNRQQIKKFNYCWIADDLQIRLAGKLSERGKINARYVGLLSRFGRASRAELKYDLLVLLSGPEPQRSLLEQTLMKWLCASTLKFFIVRGLPGHTEEDLEKIPASMYENHLNSTDLSRVITESKVVIARSGYSTIMDLARLEKKAIFIPTPGQSEQEYLAERLHTEGIAFYQKQNEFDLELALTASAKYKGFEGCSSHSNLLAKAVEELINSATD